MKNAEMSYPFFLRDGVIRLARYTARFTPKRGGEETEETVVLAVTEEEAKRHIRRHAKEGQGTLTPLDVEGLEWLDGLRADSWAEAVSLAQMGQDAYASAVREEAARTPEQLRADVDFIAAMQGVSL